MLAERWLKEGNQEKYNLGGKVLLPRQTEAPGQPGENVNAPGGETEESLKTVHWTKEMERPTNFKKSRSSLSERKHTQICVFFISPFLKKTSF